MSNPLTFIVPAQPSLRDRPLKGDGWLHEVKFDGYRVQLHKDGKEVAILSRNGADFTARFPSILQALRHLAAPRFTMLLTARSVSGPKGRLLEILAVHVLEEGALGTG